MSWTDHIAHNIEAIGAAIAAAFFSLLAREWLRSRKRLTSLEVRQDNMEAKMSKLETAIIAGTDNLSRCSTSVARDVGELAGILKVVSENQIEMSNKLDRLIDKRKNDK